MYGWPVRSSFTFVSVGPIALLYFEQLVLLDVVLVLAPCAAVRG